MGFAGVGVPELARLAPNSNETCPPNLLFARRFALEGLQGPALHTFWQQVVDEGLFSSTHERKFIGLHLFELLLKKYVKKQNQNWRARHLWCAVLCNLPVTMTRLLFSSVGGAAHAYAFPPCSPLAGLCVHSTW